MTNKKSIFILVLITVFAFLFRTYGINWDQGQHLHPDERFMTMVSADINLPDSLASYFSQSGSPLNPYNRNYNFYVYGIFPLLLVRSIGEYFNSVNYDQIFLIGRMVSVVFDCLSLVLVYKIALLLFKNYRLSLIAAFIYAAAVLPVQQSHFYTVDPLTVFLANLSLYLFLRFLANDLWLYLLLSGLIFGLTLASKTSVIIVFPLYFLILLYHRIHRVSLKNFFRPSHLSSFVVLSLLLVFSTALAFRIFQPYAFNGLLTPFPRFISNIKDAHAMITGEYDYPPNMQWTGTLPFLHPLFNISFAGFGVINTVLLLFGIYSLIKTKLFLRPQIIFTLACFLLIFSYQSIQLAKYMRYFYPVYPLMAVFAAYGFSRLSLRPRCQKILLPAVIAINLLSLFAFLTIYSHPHSRYQASLWIYGHLPLGKAVSNEVWDDSLPLNLPHFTLDMYHPVPLDLYRPESTEKWEEINSKLNRTNLLSMSSNRLWASIPRNPNRYPDTSKWYRSLFDHQTQFRLIKKIYSYPGFSLPFLSSCYLIGPTNYPSSAYGLNTFFEVDRSCTYPGVYFRDDTFEESFTVYDHPQILFFENMHAPLNGN